MKSPYDNSYDKLTKWTSNFGFQTKNVILWRESYQACTDLIRQILPLQIGWNAFQTEFYTPPFKHFYINNLYRSPPILLFFFTCGNCYQKCYRFLSSYLSILKKSNTGTYQILLMDIWCGLVNFNAQIFFRRIRLRKITNSFTWGPKHVSLTKILGAFGIEYLSLLGFRDPILSGDSPIASLVVKNF